MTTEETVVYMMNTTGGAIDLYFNHYAIPILLYNYTTPRTQIYVHSYSIQLRVLFIGGEF